MEVDEELLDRRDQKAERYSYRCMDRDKRVKQGHALSGGLSIVV